MRWMFFLGVVAVGVGCADGSEPATPSARERALRVSMDVEVADVARASSETRVAAQTLDGFVAESRADESRAHLELHVPASVLDEMRASIAHLGRVTRTDEETEDVTLAHADARAGLESARAEEARLTAMFVDRTSSLVDVLAVEHELTRVRSEIAQHDAEDRALGDRVAMARVSLELTRATPGFTSAPLAFVADAAVRGVDFAVTLGIGLAGASAFAAPSLLVMFALRLAWRARRTRPT